MSREEQLKRWLDGNPTHNNVVDECTPDFSCCRGIEHLAPKYMRQRFVDATLNGEESVVHEMLMMFLGNAVNGYNVYVAGETDNEKQRT